MFDYVRSSYPLGKDFEGELQTKTIDDFYSGTMSHYWLSPDGQLFRIDNSGTADLVETDGESFWDKFHWEPNGNHGKVTPERITKSVVVYPSKWDGDYKTWPEITIFFVNGVLQSTYSRTLDVPNKTADQAG